MSAELCARVADPSEWAEWMEAGAPPEVRAHAAGCPACQAVLADLDVMQVGLHDLAERTAAQARAMDVSEAVMAALDQAAPARRWPRVAGGLALAAVALLAARLALAPTRVGVEADPAWWTPAGAAAVELRGAVQVDLPGALRASATPASVLAPGLRLTLAPQSELQLRDLDAVGPLSGAARVRAEAPLTLTLPAARVRGQGDFEIADGDSERGHMINKRAAAGAAVVVVAVYAGWATLSTDSAEVRGQGPVGLAADARGRVSTFPLADDGASPIAGGGPEVGRGALAATAAARDEAGPEEGPTGAYWSEEAQAVRVALAGEVIDGVSGAPVSDFALSAVAEALTGYGDDRHDQTVRGAKEGKFRLDGLAQGRWRITARAEGYAPVTQAVDLTGVGADPYVVLPLSSGARLSGQVVDWRAQPVAEARVGLVECFGKAQRPGCRVVSTGADGRFVLEGVPAGPAFTVRAEHARLGSAVQPNLRRREGETEHVVLELSGVVKVFGKVTRGKARTPVAGARITTADDEYTTVTDPAGAYALFMPLEQRPQVYVRVEDGQGHAVEFGSYPERRSSEAIQWVDAPDHVAELEKDFRLAVDDARLFGRVTDAAGNPVADVKLRLWNSTGWLKGERGHETFPERTVTDADGRYAISGVPVQAGYQLTYIDAEDRRHTLGYVNVMEPGEVEANFQLGGARIRGRFVHRDSQEDFHLSGHPCSRVGAERVGPGGGYFLRLSCLEGGRFEVPDLPPGRYRIHDRVEWMDSPVKVEPVEVEVTAGQILDDVLVPVTGPESDAWRFRVLDERGRFVPGLYLRIMGRNASFTSNMEVDDKGTAEVSVNRLYKRVFVDAQGYASAEVDLSGRDPRQVLEVRMRRVE
jgi:hypothetical protein